MKPSHIAHAGGAKLRVAINTNMQSCEIPALLEKMDKFVGWGVDGAIMTDVGAMAQVHRRFPHLVLHASIGANIVNNQDVKFYQAHWGFTSRGRHQAHAARTGCA